MKFGIVDFMMASFQVALIVMKLCGAISWSWWLVMLPMILIVVLNILVLFLYVFVKVHKSRQLIKQYGTDNKLAIRMKKMQQEREEMEREIKKRTEEA
jgi:uncharacterized membrane protein